MKKLLSLLTIIALLLTALTVFASCGGNKGAASIEAKTEDGITWSYDADTKTLKIVGDNNTPVEMKAYEKASAPWHAQLKTSAVKLELSGISKISDHAFYGMYYIKEISFGDSVTELGKCAFAFCSSLTDVALPEGVTTIGESAFEGCANLKSVKLPQSVTKVETRAFAYNHALTSATMTQAFLDSITQSEFDDIFQGIIAPAVTTISAPAADNGDNSESTDTPDSTETAAPETDAPETDAPETDAPAEEPQSKTTTIIAIVVLVLVIIGVIVGAILLMRSNKNQTKDARTVRKNTDEKNGKNAKSAKNGKKSSKGKKK